MTRLVFKISTTSGHITSEHVPPLANVGDVDVKRCCDTFLAHSTLQRLENHEVLCYRRRMVDAFVVCVGFVIACENRAHLADPMFLKNIDPHMTSSSSK